MIGKLKLKLMQRRAFSAYAAGEFEKARRLFRRLLQAQPEAAGMRHNLALTHIALGDYDEAEELLLTELENFGEYYPRVRVLADLYYAAGNREQSREFYERSLEAEAPEEDVALIRKRIEITSDADAFATVMQAHEAFADGNRLMDEKRWEEAIEEFARAAECDETNVHALNNAGTIYLNNLENPAAAVDCFRRALRWAKLPWVVRNLEQAEKAAAEAQQTGQKADAEA